MCGYAVCISPVWIVVCGLMATGSGVTFGCCSRAVLNTNARRVIFEWNENMRVIMAVLVVVWESEVTYGTFPFILHRILEHVYQLL